jgi:hypothetical protein
MQLSPSAQELRNLANRIQQLSEFDTHSDTGEPDHDITSDELSRLKVTLRSLVDKKTQSRFMMVLNKMASEQPITAGEAKLITSAFVSMVDLIVSDPALMSRLRHDISTFNGPEDEPEIEVPDEEEDIAADVSPNIEYSLK